MENFGEHVEELQGMFVELREQPTFLRDEHNGAERVECVKALLRILDRGGWLAEFLLLHLPVWFERQTTPLQAMWHVSQEAINFESNIEDAKQMLHEWPHLFKNCSAPPAQEGKQL